MECRILGRSGVRISALCFGTPTFGGDADEAASGALFTRCRDAGINFFDTADAYTNGHSEEILGRLMADDRPDGTLAGFGDAPVGGDPDGPPAGRRW